jgi:hypothetical protein
MIVLVPVAGGDKIKYQQKEEHCCRQQAPATAAAGAEWYPQPPTPAPLRYEGSKSNTLDFVNSAQVRGPPPSGRARARAAPTVRMARCHGASDCQWPALALRLRSAHLNESLKPAAAYAIRRIPSRKAFGL